MNTTGSGTGGASLWDAQGLPARKQIENYRLLFLLYSIPSTLSPCPPSSCGQLIVRAQETGKACRGREKSLQSFQKLLWKHNQAHSHSQSLDANLVFTQEHGNLQVFPSGSTHTPNFRGEAFCTSPLPKKYNSIGVPVGKLKATIFSSYLLVWGFAFFPLQVFIQNTKCYQESHEKKPFYINGLSENVTKTIDFLFYG